MEQHLNPYLLVFTPDPDSNESDMNTLLAAYWQARNAVERFCAGELSESDFCETLASLDIDVDEFARTVQSNANLLNLPYGS
jgi:hypothetical protein